MSDRTIYDLKQKQSLPLNVKILMTRERVRQWINEFGEEGCYISFSGGKDSTVLLDLIRNKFGYKNIPAVFVDVPTQYPELKQFAIKFDDLIILHPKVGFNYVCNKYGFPLISKEISECIYKTRISISRGNYNTLRMKQLLGQCTNRFDKHKWLFLLDAPFSISDMCCHILKTDPIKEYEKYTSRKPFLGQLACESSKRTAAWLKTGCNAFNLKRPMSNPLAFWTENDILQYIYENDLEICSVYGDIKKCSSSDFENQLSLFDYGIMDEQQCFYKTTGCSRTGCVLCGFGCHLKSDNHRFTDLKLTHPKMFQLIDVLDNNGISYRDAILWLNKHGNFNISLDN